MDDIIQNFQNMFERSEQEVVSYRIDLPWDGEANVWIATSDDVPGLVLESDSVDALIEKLKYAIPELIELNGNKPSDDDFVLQSQRMEFVATYG